MTDNNTKGGKTSGWSERDLLSTLLNVIQVSNVTLNYNDAVYPKGRNANGFKQKINALKNTLKPEWEALGGGQSTGKTTDAGKKAPASRKRKAKSDEDENDNDDAQEKPKKRGRPKKNAKSAERTESSAEEEIKEEIKDEDYESGLDD